MKREITTKFIKDNPHLFIKLTKPTDIFDTDTYIIYKADSIYYPRSKEKAIRCSWSSACSHWLAIADFYKPRTKTAKGNLLL